MKNVYECEYDSFGSLQLRTKDLSISSLSKLENHILLFAFSPVIEEPLKKWTWPSFYCEMPSYGIGEYRTEECCVFDSA